jgi:hypothetical protein
VHEINRALEILRIIMSSVLLENFSRIYPPSTSIQLVLPPQKSVVSEVRSLASPNLTPQDFACGFNVKDALWGVTGQAAFSNTDHCSC